MARIRTDHPARRLLSLLLALLMLASLAPAALAADTPSTEAAQAAQTLYDLGLFKGTGTNPDGTPIFALEKTPTRNQALIMLIRLLGKEDEALNGSWSIPFTDVSEGMTPYVGYAYTNGLTAGTTATTFGGSKTIKANQYVTFLLRALGYTSGEDFTVSQALDFSDSLCLTFGEYTPASAFTRGDVAILSLRALSQNLKAGSSTLANRLNLSVEKPTLSQKEQLQGYWVAEDRTEGSKSVEYQILHFDGDRYEKIFCFYGTSGEWNQSVCSSGTYRIEDGKLTFHREKSYWLRYYSEKTGYSKTALDATYDFTLYSEKAMDIDKIDSAERHTLSFTRQNAASMFREAWDAVLSKYTPIDMDPAKYTYLAQSDFRGIKRTYSQAEAQCAYVYSFENMDGQAFLLTVVRYKIISNYTETTLHILGTSKVIHDPSSYYQKQADGLYGANKIHMMEIRGEVLKAETQMYAAISNHLQGKPDTLGGVFLSKADLNK